MPARAPGYDVIGYCTLYEMFADRRFVFKVVFDGKLHRCPRAMISPERGGGVYLPFYCEKKNKLPRHLQLMEMSLLRH